MSLIYKLIVVFPSPHSPFEQKSAFVTRHSSFVISPLFHHYIPTFPSYSPLVPFPFLSPRNPVSNIFNLVVLQYKSTTYIPFLYQSSIIRSSFLYPFYILTPPILQPFFTKTPLSSLPLFFVSFRILQPSIFANFQIC